MITGIYSSAAGMMHEAFKQEVEAENIARASHPGYRKRTVVSQTFPVEFANLVQDEIAGQKVINSVNNGVLASRVVDNFQPGPLHYTGQTLDAAIQGDGFFVIETPQGMAYTRNGTFTINGNNELVTMEGCRVMGEGGPIMVPNEDSKDIKIDSGGSILVGDEVVDRFRVVDFAKPYKLVKSGVAMYTAGGDGGTPSQNYEVAQGYQEASNVNIVEEMSGLIEIQRAYEMDAAVLRAQDETVTRVIQGVGTPR